MAKIRNKTDEVRRFREKAKSEWTYLGPGESVVVESNIVEGFNEGAFEILEDTSKDKDTEKKGAKASEKKAKRRKRKKRTKLTKEE